MAEVYDVQIKVWRTVVVTPSGDDEGHLSDSGNDDLIAGPMAARRQFHSYSSVQRLQAGPGQRDRNLRLFIVNHKVYPNVLNTKTNDRIEVIGEQSYTVLNVRPYDGNTQIDTEVFEQ